MTDESNDDRERPTDPVLSSPSSPEASAPIVFPSVATLPPSHPMTDIPPADADTSGPRTMLPAAFGSQPDPNSWQDRQLQILIDAMAESKAARLAYDPELLLKTSTDRIAHLVGANYSLIHSELHAVAARTAANETGIESLRTEFELIKAGYEAIKARMSQLEIAINLQHPAP